MVRYGGKGGKVRASEVTGKEACSVNQVLSFTGKVCVPADLFCGIENSKKVLTGFEKLV